MTPRGSIARFVLFVALAAGALLAVSSCRQETQPASTTIPTVSTGTPDGDGGVQKFDLAFAQSLGFSFPPAYERNGTPEHDSTACLACHEPDVHSMHAGSSEVISCIDCHGGNGNVPVPKPKLRPDDIGYEDLKEQSHVHPKLKDFWPKTGKPQVPGATTLQESQDYIRFVNPGDLRAAEVACSACHATEVKNVRTSMMAHGDMLWEAALYNNGTINRKNAVYGEAYTTDGTPAAIVAPTPPSPEETALKGWLAALWPLTRWEITQPGNILRVFERGGELRPVVGLPNTDEDSGKPDVKLSVRGFGTDVRTDPVFIGLQKTRLLDPTLYLFGTNDHPGDYRGSGCSACHVVYANDRSPVHSGYWAHYGNRGYSGSSELSTNTFPKDESGHPIKHVFVRNVPTSSCIVCHIHPGTNVLNSYLGFTWWDNETDGQFLYPNHQKNPSSAQEYQVSQHNPEQSAARGLWSDLYPKDRSAAGKVAGPDFLENVSSLNDVLPHTQLADFHGHGWIFRAVFKKDRQGQLLDSQGQVVTNVTPNDLEKAVGFQSPNGQSPPPGAPVHLKDIHLERGMQCNDCHFQQDAHGDGHIYGETRAAVELDCVDCHGTVENPSLIAKVLNDPQDTDSLAMAFSGSAAVQTNLTDAQKRDRLATISRHFTMKDGRLYQKSVLAQDPERNNAKDKGPDGWFVTQTQDTLNRNSDWGKQAQAVKVTGSSATDGSPLSQFDWARLSHTIRADGHTWGDVPPANNTDPAMVLAHSNTNVSCYACHTSWNTSCFGCHLPMRANQRKTMLHNEGILTRNYTNYNYQTIRDDLYMLGIDSTVKQHKVVPVRSACAVLVSSQDANRQWIYTQQQTISAEGLAGTAFSPYFPHTVRATETRHCTDCHVSSTEDNNAIMAQLLMQGTHAVNFIGRFAWVGLGDHGLQAVAVTERDEPQAVIGSRLHELAYPDNFRDHQNRKLQLTESYGHGGHVRDLQLRGEYLYAACGSDGFIAYDVANIDNKGFSQRIITAPVSTLGQQFFVRTKSASSVCSPSTMALDPTRPHLQENEEASVQPLYAYIYVTDEKEGLVVIGNSGNGPNRPGVATLLDGNPDNNYLQRALTYNPDGLLNGARKMALYGHYAFICCDAGIIELDLSDPLNPRHIATLDQTAYKNPRKIVFQFRYGFVVDDDGVHVFDMTYPEIPTPLYKDGVPLGVNIFDARDLYISRTYGYVAAGSQGLAILNLEKPRDPDTWNPTYFNANGQISDATAVRTGMTNASMFAYVADGKNGLKVIQLTSADDEQNPTFLGYSPVPHPRLIAQFKTDGPAIALSEGLDRDRAVDESGNQLSVFGRRGARPFNLQEQQKLFLRPDSEGRSLYLVTDDAPGAAIEPDPKRFQKPASAQPDTDQGQ